MMFVGSSAMAQISNPTTITGGKIHKAIYCNGISYQEENGVIKIYDENFDCIKTVKLFNTSRTSLRIHCLTKNTFTNSGKFEFIVTGSYRDKDDWYDVNAIYNEDGQVIYNFSKEIADYRYQYNAEDNPFITGDKLVVNVEYSWDEEAEVYAYAAQIFNLTGSNASSPSLEYKNSTKLYPNPANNSVTLEYNIQGQMQEMQIVDINGCVVATYLLDPSQKQVNINTSNYKKGVYIYRYGNNSGKFIVE